MWPELRLNIVDSLIMVPEREREREIPLFYCPELSKPPKYTLHTFFYWFRASFTSYWLGRFFFLLLITF